MRQEAGDGRHGWTSQYRLRKRVVQRAWQINVDKSSTLDRPLTQAVLTCCRQTDLL